LGATYTWIRAVTNEQHNGTARSETIHVFRLNAFEWWAARTIDEAFAGAALYWNLPRYEIADELYPAKILSATQLDAELCASEAGVITFNERLAQMISGGETFPRLFGLATGWDQ
jgi:hypothetical protein